MRGPWRDTIHSRTREGAVPTPFPGALTETHPLPGRKPTRPAPAGAGRSDLWIRARRAVALVLSVLMSGCVSVSVQRREEAPGGIRIAVYPDAKGARAGRPGPYGVLSELFVREGKAWRKVKVSLLPEWGVADPPPGRYRVVVERRINEQGHIEALRGAKVKEFNLREGEGADVRVLLKAKPPTAAIVVGALVGVAIIWVLVEALSGNGGDLPDLPLPPPEALDIAADIFLHAAWSASLSAEMGWSDTTAPRLIANFPLHRDPRSDPATHLFLNFSEPVKSDWDDETLQVIGSESGRVEGRFIHHAGGDMVEFAPAAPFQPGETVTVTLDGDRVEDLAGNEMGDQVSYSFSVR